MGQFVRLSQLRKLRECQQVAAVCYRVGSAGIEFLLVQTRGSGRWTFPKGKAEPGLTHAQAAALEAFEEAGVHGRIEEVSFARYVRGRSDRKEFAVNAHLCQVLRLGSPREPDRKRTWFSVEDTRRRLREGRARSDGAGFVRVVDRAVARIERLHYGSGIAVDRPEEDRTQEDRPKDALQKVRFEAVADASGRAPRASWMPYVRLMGERRQLSGPGGDDHSREILPCEVLEFSPAQEINRNPRWTSGEKKAKALGTGAKNG